MEDHHVAAFNPRNVVDKLVDKQPVAVFQTGQHAGAFHPNRLVKEGNNQHGSGCRNQQIAQPKPDSSRFWQNC